MIRSIFKTTLPVAFGYVPLGMAFGVLLQSQGYAWFFAPLMGIFIYAGSAQFLALTLLAAGAGAVEAFTATLLLNLRHIFYGLSVLDRYKTLSDTPPPGGQAPKRRFDAGRFYAIFGLTDETFSIISGLPKHPEKDRSFVIGVTLVNQCWWVFGCTAGALFATGVAFNTAGLEFSLTALFAVLLVDQVKRTRAILPLVAAAVAAALTLTAIAAGILPMRWLLISAIGVSCLFMFFYKKEAEL